MTLVATSVDFDYNFVSLYPYDGMLIAEGFTGYETNIADGSLYEINTSNLAVVNSYIHGENLSANFWGSMAFGASDIFSGAEQHIYEFSSGISNWRMERSKR